MMKKLTLAITFAMLPAAAFAQGTVRDPAGGSTSDPVLAVPIAAPPLTRDPAGGTMIDDTPRFRSYMIQEEVPSYTFAQPVVVGSILPETGVVYREVPVEYGVRGYSFTVVNGRAVIVEPHTRRIVQIIN